MKKVRYYFPYIKLLFYIIVPIFVLLVPIDYFDSGESICLSIVFFDFECYACGMTSAIKHLLHFDFETAFAYNMLSFIVFPILSLMWAGWTYIEIRRLWARHKPNTTTPTQPSAKA
ncbi:MAG: DUF2752 domain-containing protein [Bernardetiaceae bacterium]|nr:DUF2752 domain-containing protein [Bernardetiaceae bacterium]